MRLALGTVQFGLAYGVVGRAERIGDEEARQIFDRAAELDIDLLDTAPGYGDIEQRLAALSLGRGPEPATGGAEALGAANGAAATPVLPASRFTVVTKIAPLAGPNNGSAKPVSDASTHPVSDAMTGAARGTFTCPDPTTDSATAVALVSASLKRSRARLGSALQSVLFHSADDLLGQHGDSLWNAASRLTGDWGVRLGVSCYGPAQLQSVCERFPVAVAQLPGNAFDQRLMDRRFPQVELHVRSAFLQGLLLAPADIGGSRVPAAASALMRWHAGCAARGLSPLQAALGAVKALPGVQRCLVGVDSRAQLEEVAAAWQRATPLAWPELATEDPAVIDPRTWGRA